MASQVAEEQASLLRKGIGEMFVNLARRNQALLDRQIEFIDELERGEEDPDQLDNLHSPMSPGGETWAEFSDRIGGAMHRVAAEHAGRTVVIACHGGVVDVALRTLLEVAAEARFELYTHNASMTEIVYIAHRDRWRLVRYNDAAHLASIGTT